LPGFIRFRVEHVLHLAEGADQLGTEHLGQQLARDWPSPCSPDSEPP
jgi:hypothetical protein